MWCRNIVWKEWEWEIKRKKKVYKNKIDENAVRNHEDMYTCYQCDFTAKQRNHLKVHVDSNHDNVRYICDQWDYTATQKDQLKYHVESNYVETRNNCDQCDYSATRKDQLKHHVETTNEKLF